MAGIDKRKEPRIPVALLPPEYAEFTILLPHGQEATVRTLDASQHGFGFTSTLPPDNFIIGTRLVLYPLGTELPVFGTIRFSACVDGVCRVGLELTHAGGYCAYCEAFKPFTDA